MIILCCQEKETNTIFFFFRKKEKEKCLLSSFQFDLSPYKDESVEYIYLSQAACT
jgi:hypothetical protein